MTNNKIDYETKLRIVENDVNIGRFDMLEALKTELLKNNQSTKLIDKALKIAWDNDKCEEYDRITYEIIDKYELNEAYDILWV